jgi:hypothetical protein
LKGANAYIFNSSIYLRATKGGRMEEKIPLEINDHLKIFGKDADEVDYDAFGPCPFCGSRIDEFNFCACGGNLGV